MRPEHGTSAGKLTLRCTSADGLTQCVRRRSQTTPSPRRRRSCRKHAYLILKAIQRLVFALALALFTGLATESADAQSVRDTADVVTSADGLRILFSPRSALLPTTGYSHDRTRLWAVQRDLEHLTRPECSREPSTGGKPTIRRTRILPSTDLSPSPIAERVS
jgi:hypothetical protein